MSEPAFSPGSILNILKDHGVDYVLVGGLAARAHGASRATADLDLVARTDDQNLNRLAAALREMTARLRVDGMTDAEARALPVIIDAVTLASFGSSTWMTDHGPLDVLAALRDDKGRDIEYSDLRRRGDNRRIGTVVVRVAGLSDIIASKEFADRPKDHEALPELRRLAEP